MSMTWLDYFWRHLASTKIWKHNYPGVYKTIGQTWHPPPTRAKITPYGLLQQSILKLREFYPVHSLTKLNNRIINIIHKIINIIRLPP